MHIIEVTVGKTNAQFEIEEIQSGDDLNFVAVGGGETKHPVIEHEEGWTWASIFFGNDTGADDLVPGTTYTLQNGSGDTYEFTTTSDPSRVATQSQWEDLTRRVKLAEDTYHFSGSIEDVNFDELAAAIDSDKIITYSPSGPLNDILVVAQEHNFDGLGTEYCALWTVGPESGMLDDTNSPMVITRYYLTREEGSSSQMGPLTMLTGSGAPGSVTRGALGQLYTNLNTMETYQCTAINNSNYVWTKRW